MSAEPESAEPEGVPPGATCPPHGAEATFTCTRCGTFGCADCAFSSVAGREVCRACAALGLGEPVPWERRRELGTWRSFWSTTSLLLRSPRRFFRTPTTHGDVFAAVAHGTLSLTLGLFLTYALMGVLVMLTGGGVALFAPGEAAQPIGTAIGTYGCMLLGGSPFFAAIFGPMNALMGQVFAAAGAHATLALAKKARGGFEDTLRVTAYANAPYVLQFVPLLGMLTWFWVVSIEIVGLREVHRCGTDWAAIAALGYRLVLGVLMGATYAAVIGSMLVLAPTR